MIVKTKYLLHYSPLDYPEMKESKEDVYYENKGKLYSQFFKGDLIPTEIWNSLFNSKDNNSNTDIVKETDDSKSKAEEPKVEEKEKKVKEKKPRKKRSKSIIKNND